jgi:hypothetical protein
VHDSSLLLGYDRLGFKSAEFTSVVGLCSVSTALEKDSPFSLYGPCSYQIGNAGICKADPRSQQKYQQSKTDHNLFHRKSPFLDKVMLI